jgi:glycerophosphoryl diester phosphodiesterase/endonuclease/exonuclease/phosphatase family metal-dependent hydrolase
MTLIASHRGGALEWPENSPTAFHATAGLPVDQVEFDIHPTADGEIVVFHDATLERTSNGHGEVAAHTLAELKALVLTGTDGEAMLTLAEFATIFSPTSITLRMELKSDAQQTPYLGLLAKALAVLDAHGLRGRTIVTSFNVGVAAEAARIEGLVSAIWLVSPAVQAEIGVAGLIGTAAEHGVDRVGLRCTHLDEAMLAALRAAGLGVGAWAVNDALQIADMLSLGVDVFTTDRPTLALLLRDGVAPVCGRTETPTLSPVSLAERNGFIALPDTRAAHTKAHGHVAAFGEIETGGEIAVMASGPSFRLGAWNLERCLYPERSAAMLARAGISLTLLTEMDKGCHRTGQRHTITDLASMLGQLYAYAVEFVELSTMPQPVPMADTSAGNKDGFHGNGLVSALGFASPIVIRLDEVADWYANPRFGQKRIGTRMAVAATFTLGEARFVACSVHLESASDAPGRALQFRTLMDALDTYAAGLPVVIGGDLNTHVHGPDEALFEIAKQRGYDWTDCNVMGATTRPSVWSDGAADCKLDWLCTRGFIATAPEVIPAVDTDGTVLSDHDLVVVTLSLR